EGVGPVGGAGLAGHGGGGGRGGAEAELLAEGVDDLGVGVAEEVGGDAGGGGGLVGGDGLVGHGGSFGEVGGGRGYRDAAGRALRRKGLGGEPATDRAKWTAAPEPRPRVQRSTFADLGVMR